MIKKDKQLMDGVEVKKEVKEEEHGGFVRGIIFTQKMALQIADEVVKHLTFTKKEKQARTKVKITPLANAWFLDTSAIVDLRIFNLLRLNLFSGNLVVIDSVLSELKNLADSKDTIKRERGRKALESLEQVKKGKVLGKDKIKFQILKDADLKLAVDDRLIKAARKHKGKIITCDFNLAKKAIIAGIAAIDIHEVANALKIQAVPGDTFFLKIVQKGKGEKQGVGFLPDGTMIVVENGEDFLDKTVKVSVVKLLQTDAGKILFSKIVS